MMDTNVEPLLLKAYHALSDPVAHAAPGVQVAVTPEGRFLIDDIDFTPALNLEAVYDEYKNTKRIMARRHEHLTDYGEADEERLGAGLVLQAKARKVAALEQSKRVGVKARIVGTVLLARPGHKAELRDGGHTVVIDGINVMIS